MTANSEPIIVQEIFFYYPNINQLNFKIFRKIKF